MRCLKQTSRSGRGPKGGLRQCSGCVVRGDQGGDGWVCRVAGFRRATELSRDVSVIPTQPKECMGSGLGSGAEQRVHMHDAQKGHAWKRAQRFMMNVNGRVSEEWNCPGCG